MTSAETTMRIGLPGSFVIALVSLNVMPFPALSEDAEGLSKRGQELSRLHCARCHIIDDVNPFGGISSTPSFPLIVNELSDWEERFGSFHTRLPHPSIIRFENEEPDPLKPDLIAPIRLKNGDIDAFLAYARTLSNE